MEVLHILAIGAHPDDCDVKVGGIAIKYARAGHQVKFVSMTNGDAGHFEIGGRALAKRRYDEAQCAAQVAGIEYQVVDTHDSQLLPTLENRWLVVRIIRDFRPHLVVTHRPNDYHPDHRYTSQLVQDAAYTVTVPQVVPLTAHLPHNPVIAYMSDGFQRPYPFSPDVAIDVDDAIDAKFDMLNCHTSQFYEWLPYNRGILHQVPNDPEAQRRWLFELRAPYFASLADRHRGLLTRLYGPERGARVEYAEALEICEYGASVDPSDLPTLFPFFNFA
jgi:LmbE family N-acetylglucosaminyl deacetylase